MSSAPLDVPALVRQVAAERQLPEALVRRHARRKVRTLAWHALGRQDLILAEWAGAANAEQLVVEIVDVEHNASRIFLRFPERPGDAPLADPPGDCYAYRTRPELVANVGSTLPEWLRTTPMSTERRAATLAEVRQACAVIPIVSDRWVRLKAAAGEIGGHLKVAAEGTGIDSPGVYGV